MIGKLVGRKNSNNILFYELDKPTGMNSIIKTKLKSFIQKKQQISWRPELIQPLPENNVPNHQRLAGWFEMTDQD